MQGFIYAGCATEPAFSIVAISDQTVLDVAGDMSQRQSIIDRAYALHQELVSQHDVEADPIKVEELQQLTNTLLFKFSTEPSQELFIGGLRKGVRPGHLVMWFYEENQQVKFRTAQRFFTEQFSGPMPVSVQAEYVEILNY
jgi:hypothetical protein